MRSPKIDSTGESSPRAGEAPPTEETDTEQSPSPKVDSPPPPEEKDENAALQFAKGAGDVALDFIGFHDAKAAITGVDEDGNEIGWGERLFRGALVVPIAKPVKGGKMALKYGDKALTAGKKNLDDVARKGKKTACGCPFSPHYKVAKEGGKHSGFYKQYVSKSNDQINKGISSIQKQIEEHEDKIKNPTKYIPGFKELDPRQQKALLTKNGHPI